MKWAGGKTKLLGELQARLPKAFGRYFEPFAGGAALFFQLAPSRAVLNDANENLIGMYRMVARDAEAVIRRLELHQQHHGTEYYYDVRERWNDASVSWTPLERAAAFIYLNKACFNGLWRVNRAGEFNVPIGTMKKTPLFQPEAIRAAAAALQAVELRCGDYAKAVADAEEGDLVYFDPPYDAGADDRNFTAYAAGGFGPDDQRALAVVARGLVARGCHVVLSNRDTPFVREIYDGMTIDRVEIVHSMSGGLVGRGATGEVIIRAVA